MDPVFRAVVTLGYSGGRRTGKGDHQALAVQVRGGGGGGGGRGGDLGPGVTKAGWRSDSHLFPGLQQGLVLDDPSDHGYVVDQVEHLGREQLVLAATRGARRPWQGLTGG